MFAAVAEERDGIAAEPPVDIEAWAARWNLERTLVAVADGQLVGHIIVVESSFGYGEIGMLVVADWRGRGVGSALVAAAIDWARARELHKLTLGVFPHNEAALALYRKFGFVEEGRRIRHMRRANGELWDLIEMGLPLTDSMDVPPVVREKARAVGASAWIDGLPHLIASIEADWGITVGRAYRDSTEAFVAEAVCADGTPAVLKLIVPRDGGAAANEITALQLAAGEGCPRLLRDDVARGALLLERLGRSLYELQLPLDRRHEILVSSAMRIWRPAAQSGLPTGAAKAAWLAEFIASMWEELDRPCSERAVEYALACAKRRGDAHRDDRAVLVHGDVHQWNALEADGEYKLVDPDGLLAEPEYDLGIIMREDPLDGDLRARARRLAGLTGLDETAIWEWGAVERVSTGLLGTRVGLQPVARHMLDAADRLRDDAR